MGTEQRPRRFEDKRAKSERNEKLGVWARLFAVGLLGGSMLWWPYAHSCGVGLSLYLAATMMIVVGGLWVVACTWIQRMASTHAIAMLVALWGVALILIEILPRVGYASPDPSNPVSWLCR
jgi:branched-subunit amino acid ABC-type transport system permease component